jgi:aspartate 1-decarboxylase
MHAKLHHVKVTEAKKYYVGSITIDKDLIEKVGILPLEEVEIVNLDNGNRWSTYVLPGPAGSGCICPNGGGALLCSPGDTLIIFSYELKERENFLQEGHTAKVIVADEQNKCKEFFYQTVSTVDGKIEFSPNILQENYIKDQNNQIKERSAHKVMETYKNPSVKNNSVENNYGEEQPEGASASQNNHKESA